MIDGGIIDTRTAGEGDAGALTVRARDAMLTNGGEISSGINDTSPGGTGEGSGGNVNVVVPGTLSISGSPGGFHSGIFTSAGSDQGNAGNIVVSTGKLDISHAAVITSLSLNDRGDAGNIVIDVADMARLANGFIVAGADHTNGGNITLTADSVQLTQGSEITSKVFGNPDTTGGNVTINGGSLVLLDDSKVTASALKGKGGAITVNSDVFLHDAKSVRNVLIATSGTRGNDGTVTVNSPDTDIAGSITRLPISFLNAAALLSQRCAARTAEDTSSFVIIGRGGVPSGPDNWALSGYTEGGSAAMKTADGEATRSRKDLRQTIRPHLMAIKLTCASKPAL